MRLLKEGLDRMTSGENVDLIGSYSTYRGLLHSRCSCAVSGVRGLSTHLYGLPNDYDDEGFRHRYVVHESKISVQDMVPVPVSVVEDGSAKWEWDIERNVFIKRRKAL